MDHVEFAIQVAKEAGNMIQNRFGSCFTIEQKSNSFDLVTEVDQASEQMIRQSVMERFPDHAVIGEEGSVAKDDREHHDTLDQYVWIVDPLDGTTNFVYGLPGYTVSIALAYQNEIIVGVVYDPVRDELFWAKKGMGAFLHDKKLAVSTHGKIEESVIATGFPSIEKNRSAVIEGIRVLGPRCQNLRVFGSAALHMAYVATGRLSAFWEIGLHHWDVAAGSLLVQEAGGSVTDTHGRFYDLSTTHILASNGKIHHEMIHYLQQANATGC